MRSTGKGNRNGFKMENERDRIFFIRVCACVCVWWKQQIPFKLKNRTNQKEKEPIKHKSYHRQFRFWIGYYFEIKLFEFPVVDTTFWLSEWKEMAKKKNQQIMRVRVKDKRGIRCWCRIFQPKYTKMPETHASDTHSKIDKYYAILVELSCNKLCVSSLFFRPFTFISNAFTFTERPQLFVFAGFWMFLHWKWYVETFAHRKTIQAYFSYKMSQTKMAKNRNANTHPSERASR